jgi:hypothetical protein
VGVRDSHFTITPITDATGKLRFVVVIFAAKEVSLEWSLGIDIFTDWDSEDEYNFGPGKRHPSLTLVSPDGKDIPVMFAANTKASMTSGILKEAFKKWMSWELRSLGLAKMERPTVLPLSSMDTSLGWGKTSCGM